MGKAKLFTSSDQYKRYKNTIRDLIKDHEYDLSYHGNYGNLGPHSV